MSDYDFFSERPPKPDNGILGTLISPWGRFVIVLGVLAVAASFFLFPQETIPSPTPTPVSNEIFVTRTPVSAFATEVANIASQQPTLESLYLTATAIVKMATDQAFIPSSTAAPATLELTATAIVQNATQTADAVFNAITGTETSISTPDPIIDRSQINALSVQLENDPENPDLYYERGNLYYDLGEYYMAAQDYSSALKLRPDDPNLYNSRGNAYQGYEQYDLALQDYGRAIELGHEPLAWPYNNRGNVYFAQGDYERAIEDYDRALEDDPAYATAYYNRATAYFNQGLYRDAIDDYTLALDNGYTPEAEAYDLRGSSYAILGQYGQAVNDYSRAIEANPAYASPYLGRGIAHSELGNRTASASDYLRWIQLSETYPVENEPITSGEVQELQMGTGWVYYLPFQAQAGDRLTISADAAAGNLLIQSDEGGLSINGTPVEGSAGILPTDFPQFASSDVDPLIVVLDPSDAPLVGDDDSGGDLNSLIERFELRDSGQYILVVSHAGGGAEGFVRVLLEIQRG
jgi:tetratricopeptide (TPR) repeat protein